MEQTHRDEGFQKMSPYEVVAGVVQEVKTYGAFVDIGGGTIALLHISQVSHSRIESMQRVFKVRRGPHWHRFWKVGMAHMAVHRHKLMPVLRHASSSMSLGMLGHWPGGTQQWHPWCLAVRPCDPATS
jgi:hypothetical protein